MKLCVIPARGGSKRIPRKNIKDFCGKPMIAWSIEKAIQSGCFDEVCVSTDDYEIAEIAQQYGASVPFIRPAHLSDDFATTVDVMKHAVDFYQINGNDVKYVCCIYATAPFLDIQDLQLGIEKIQQQNLDYVFSATNYVFPIQRAIKIKNERVEMFNPEAFNMRSQDLEEAWHDAGQFYWGTAQAWLEKKKIFDEQSGIVALPHYRVQDIDTIEDWQRAELMSQFLLKPQV